MTDFVTVCVVTTCDALSGATAIGKPNNIEKYSLRAHFDDIVGSKHQKVIPNESDL
jgi:hypothetical protein